MDWNKVAFLLAAAVVIQFPVSAAQEVFSSREFLPPAFPDSGNVKMELVFIEGISGQVMEGYEAIVEYADGDITIEHLESVMAHTALPGKKSFRVILDDLQTPEPDYASGYYEVDAGRRTIAMQAIGSVRGVVYLGDERQAGVEVAYECGRYVGIVGVANEMGFYSGNLIPAGSCRIKAESGELYAEEHVRLKRGEIADVDLHLETCGFGAIVYGLGVLNIILIAAATSLYMKKGKRRKQAPAPRPEEGGKTKEREVENSDEAERREGKAASRKIEEDADRIRTVLKTLNDRDKKVVQFLLARGGAARQSDVYHELEIPKTSLIREISALEDRKLVESEETGKTRMLSLSDWFYPPELKDAGIVFGDEADMKIEVTGEMRNRIAGLEKRRKRIVCLLLENGGSLLQSRLHRETNIPKSTLGRLINDLKIKGIVQTSRFRKTKRVELTKCFLGGKDES